MDSWRECVAKALQRRDLSLSKIPGDLSQIDDTDLQSNNVTTIPDKVLSADDRDITQKNAEELLLALASGSLSSVAVTTAFLRRASLAQKLVSVGPAGFKFCCLLLCSLPQAFATVLILAP